MRDGSRLRASTLTTTSWRLFVHATELDPNYASPYGMASWSGALRNSYGWMVDRENEIADAVRHARRAVAVGKDDPTALWSGGLSLAYLGKGGRGWRRVHRPGAGSEPEFGGELDCERLGAHVPWRVRQRY